MNSSTLMTYSLLAHLKETHYANHSSIVEVFFPIVKKAIVEYAKDSGKSNIQGKEPSEINTKIYDFFGLELPPSVLDFILKQIDKEIANEKVFAYYQDKSFIINSFVFSNIDSQIENESDRISILRKDFEKFCRLNDEKVEFGELIQFITSQKIEVFDDKDTSGFNYNYIIPKYVAEKFDDEKIFQIMSDIFLGNLIESYLEFNIKKPVAKTELLIDTNYFISLIDLNSYEAYLTCTQLFDIGKKLGYRFSILYCTIDQIKALLSRKIKNFDAKETGIVYEEDIFGACIRRGLNKTDLERIKDRIDTLIQEKGIDVIYESRIRGIVSKAKKSKKYKEFLEIRKKQELSALNDTIAYHYVKFKRKNHIEEFSDVDCWFLNNSYHDDYYSEKGYKLHERFKINANELLSLLWLANPNQQGLNKNALAKGGLSNYIAKFRSYNAPTLNVIKDINKRAKKIQEQGSIEERDIYSLSIRMAEGHLVEEDAKELLEEPDEDFIRDVKKYTLQHQKLQEELSKQNEKIDGQNTKVDELKSYIQKSEYRSALNEYGRNKINWVFSETQKISSKMHKVTAIYLVFIIVLIILWFSNYLYAELINSFLAAGIAFVLFLGTSLIQLINHENAFKCMKFTFSEKFREKTVESLKDELEIEYEKRNPKPKESDFVSQ